MNEIIKNKQTLKVEAEEEQCRILEEITGTEHLMNQTLDEEENHILTRFYEADQKKRSIELEIEYKNKEKHEVKEELQEFEFELRRENSLLSSKNKELKDLEIEVNRINSLYFGYGRRFG